MSVETGVQWLEKAAKAGHPGAQLELGTLYLKGVHVTLELPRFRGQFIALAVMKYFSNHSALNRIPKARALCSAR